MAKEDGKPIDAKKMEAIYQALTDAGFKDVVISSLVLKRRVKNSNFSVGGAPVGLTCQAIELSDGSYKIVCS